VQTATGGGYETRPPAIAGTRLQRDEKAHARCWRIVFVAHVGILGQIRHTVESFNPEYQDSRSPNVCQAFDAWTEWYEGMEQSHDVIAVKVEPTQVLPCRVAPTAS